MLGYEADLLDNSGTVDGDVDMGDGDDAVINDGTVTGTVELGAGNDSFEGGSSDETVSGGDGDDVISAGKGDDVLAGGSGDDIFAFVKHGGSNSIQDFEDGPDLIDLTALNTAFGDLDIQETGGHSVITFGDLEIVVESVTGLGAEDFIF